MNNAAYDGIFLAPESIVVFPGLASSAFNRFVEAAAGDDERVATGDTPRGQQSTMNP